jgi:hypothetical protein
VNLKYKGGKENYKQVLIKLIDDMADIKADILEVLRLEFPEGTTVFFKYGRGSSVGEVCAWYVKGHDINLNVKFQTGKHHWIPLCNIQRK